MLRFGPLTLSEEPALTTYLRGFADAGEGEIPAYFGKPEWSFGQTVATLAAWARGEELGDFVANTTVFLRDGDVLVGHYNFRHELTPRLEQHGGHIGYSVGPPFRRRGFGSRLLAHGMDFGRQLGLPRILVTCSPDNPGSIGVIRNQGGVLQDTIFFEPLECQVSRFWVEL